MRIQVMAEDGSSPQAWTYAATPPQRSIARSSVNRIGASQSSEEPVMASAVQ
jgi:hypothetical protein